MVLGCLKFSAAYALGSILFLIPGVILMFIDDVSKSVRLLGFAFFQCSVILLSMGFSHCLVVLCIHFKGDVNRKSNFVIRSVNELSGEDIINSDADLVN